jgi:lactoylglutathione lyase
MSSDKPAFIHHVNFPTTNPERTIEWYSKVFGMKYIKPKSNTQVVLMTCGKFDLHFTPVETMDRMAPYHFAVEVEDWDGFLEHVKSLGIRHTRVITRPENNSQFCYIHDPDHTMIELVFHARRPYPPVTNEPQNRGISQTEFGNKINAGAGLANSADDARSVLNGTAPASQEK